MLPETSDDEQLTPRSVNISRWKRGTYKLSKEPIGFKNDDLLIGIDPGTYIQVRKYESTEKLIAHRLYVSFRDLVTAVDVSHGHIINKQTTKYHTFPISNGNYKTTTQEVFAQIVPETGKKN
ncbi:hypothetical protein RMCBS344292_03159 [Rhizopus microsporus]|nr:hypothetical protein RMCBS344292_03159 [Rhizopus microsporus]